VEIAVDAPHFPETQEARVVECQDGVSEDRASF
jgi:hypothetical protein